MNAADHLTAENIRELISTPGPAITIVLAGNETGDTAIELKNVLNHIGREFEARNRDAESLLDAIPGAAADFRGETKSKGNIAILRAQSLLRIFRVDRSVRPIARVGPHFDVRTLLEIRNAQKHFYIVALSQNRSRLLGCTESTSHEIELTGTPVSYAESRHTRKPDHVLDNRITAGPSMGSGGGVMFGTSSDMDDKDEYVLHFFMELDKGVSNALRGSSDPLIPAGVEHELALYRRVNTYPHLLEPGIHGVQTVSKRGTSIAALSISSICAPRSLPLKYRRTSISVSARGTHRLIFRRSSQRRSKVASRMFTCSRGLRTPAHSIPYACA